MIARPVYYWEALNGPRLTGLGLFASAAHERPFAVVKDASNWDDVEFLDPYDPADGIVALQVRSEGPHTHPVFA